jgi:MarR family transcriptional regulator, negative regulator of the multidrug operon emrRAB
MEKNKQYDGGQCADRFVGNILGAFSRAVSDKMDEAVQKEVGLNSSACYTIVQVGTEPNCSIETLRRRLALEHSSVVRVIDRLEKSDLLARVRGLGEDRREVAIVLTQRGEDCFTRILRARETFLRRVTATLDDDQKATLRSFINTMMREAVEGGDDQHYVCRLCDPDACPQDICPVNCAHPEFYEEPSAQRAAMRN